MSLFMSSYPITIIGCGLVLILGISRLTFTKISSFPYRSTLYIEPSSINTKLVDEDRMGFDVGRWWIGMYWCQKRKETQQGKNCFVYVLGSASSISKLQDEFYYNNPNIH
jgi:hypothetical protein